MSKVLDTKQLVHIGIEALVVISIVVYFSQRHKKVMGHITDLVQRVEEQEDTIQALYTKQKEMESQIQALARGLCGPAQQAVKPEPVKATSKVKVKKQPVHKPEPFTMHSTQEYPVGPDIRMTDGVMSEQISSEHIKDFIPERHLMPEMHTSSIVLLAASSTPLPTVQEDSRVEEIIDNEIVESEDDDDLLDEELKEELKDLEKYNN